ncbi:hypothetical protein GCM10027605_04980 [Micromonospora zhanjiangensis]
MGDPDQPAYLNAVVLVVDPAAGPRDWLTRARAVEDAAGRVRDPARRYGPRSIDVDVVTVWDDRDEPVLRDDPELTLPHPGPTCGRSSCVRGWTSSRTAGCPGTAG